MQIRYSFGKPCYDHPTFFNKTTFHKVSTSDESLFDAIANWEERNEPNYGFRQHLQEETLVPQKAIESIITKGRSLTESGRSLVLNCFSWSVSFMDGLINHVNTTYRELTILLFSSKNTWHLVSSLARRILEDFCEPRIGVLKALRTKQETQFSTLT